MNEVTEEMLKKYDSALSSQSDYENALKAILQEIVLLGLSRSGFFEKAAFYGGTALRIFHGLDRFSEDLDFTLFSPDPKFKLDAYFSMITQEIKAYGFDFSLERVEAGTHLLMLNIQSTQKFASKIQKSQKIKIKFEIDVDPAINFDTEIKLQYLPSPYTAKLLKLPDLFAGKMHAVLYRKWEGRVKGRDFYDLQWYLARNTPLKTAYFEEKARASGELAGELTRDRLISIFLERIRNMDWPQAKQDVLPFLKDKRQVEFWSYDFFKQLIEKIQLV